jgi:hypothetical protein
MRVSVENGDRGWDVWVEGVKLENVVMADDELGEVEVFWSGGRETIYGRVEIRRSVPNGTPKVQGLVAPTWSDSGEVPVGEVTYTVDFTSLECDQSVPAFIKWPKPSDPNAKPAMPALSRIAGEAYRGLGWCDEESV